MRRYLLGRKAANATLDAQGAALAQAILASKKAEFGGSKTLFSEAKTPAGEATAVPV